MAHSFRGFQAIMAEKVQTAHGNSGSQPPGRKEPQFPSAVKATTHTRVQSCFRMRGTTAFLQSMSKKLSHLALRRGHW